MLLDIIFDMSVLFPVLGIKKTIFLELCAMQNEEEHVKEKFTRHKNLRSSPLGLRPQSCSDFSL